MADTLPVKPFFAHEGFPRIDGVIHVRCITREMLEAFSKLPFHSRHVLVATYPKSGTTWVEETLWQIFHNGEVDQTSIHERVPYLEFLPATRGYTIDDIIKTVETNRIFKTHIYSSILLQPKNANPPKYVNIIRNPKDTAVSYFNFCKALIPDVLSFDGEWDEFFEMFIRGEVLCGNWFDHVLGWWQHRDDPNVLILKYEDMKKDLQGAVKTLAEFVGRDLSPEIVKKIAEQTHFNAMTGKDQFEMKDVLINGKGFIRKGQVGDWKNYFTKDQTRRIDELIEEKLKGTGLEFEYE